MKRKFFIMLWGGAVAQAITFISLPFLSRLYTPESFGYLAGVMSLASICASVLHGRYHMAIPIAKNPQDPRGLLWLSVLLSFALAMPTVLIAVRLTSNQWVESSHFAYVATCLVFAIGTALLDIASYWLSYRERFSVIAQNQSLRTLFTAITQIIAAPYSLFGMVIGALMGLWAAIGLFVYRQGRREDGSISWPGWSAILELARRYRHLPFYGTPQGLLAAASWNLLPLALLRSEGASVAGLYWAAYRILIAPLTLFNSSYRQVTLRALGQMPQVEALRMLRRHTATLAVIGAGLALLLLVMADILFTILLGPDWEGAAEIAGALSLGIAADLFKVPSICFEQSRHRQKRLMRWEAAIFFLRYIPTLFLMEMGETILGVMAFSVIGLLGWALFSVRSLFFTPEEEALF
jgi:O-antigen/teichoic acid export membrane protein